MTGPRAPAVPDPPAWILRPLGAEDHPALLRLNAENRPALAAVDAGDLPGLLAGAHHSLVAVDRRGLVLGFVLSFPRDSDFRDTEIDELRRLIAAPFYYICQVAVVREYRGTGIGRAFYGAIANAARGRGAGLLCCDVNTAPPNPESLAFHRRLGFREIGVGVASNGFEIVYLAKPL